MKRTVCAAIFLLVILAIVTTKFHAQEDQNNSSIEIKNLEDVKQCKSALKLNQQRSRPLIALITSGAWCPPCVEVNREFLKYYEQNPTSVDYVVIFGRDHGTKDESRAYFPASEVSRPSFPLYTIESNDADNSIYMRTMGLFSTDWEQMHIVPEAYFINRQGLRSYVLTGNRITAEKIANAFANMK